MKFRHEITISPDTMEGKRGWWSASVEGYDGHGCTIKEALCDLIDNLAEELHEYGAF